MARTRARLAGLLAGLAVALGGAAGSGTLFVPGAAAKDAPLKAFFGTFVGRGITKASAADYYGLRNRDLNVSITSHGEGGFRLVWKTIKRTRGEAETDTTGMTYLPAKRPGLWRAKESGDLIAGERVSWARIEGRTLLVYVMALQANTGRIQLSIYRRRLAPGGLFLQFRRVVEGRSDRFVEALLKRAK